MTPDTLAFAEAFIAARASYRAAVLESQANGTPLPEFPALPAIPVPFITPDLTCEQCDAPAIHTAGTLSFTLASPDTAALALQQLAAASTTELLHNHCTSNPSNVHALGDRGEGTVITYDVRMLAHEETQPAVPKVPLCPGLPPEPKAPHPERPDRLEAIVSHLLATGVYQRCIAIPCREAQDSELALVHAPHVLETVKSKEAIPAGEVRPWAWRCCRCCPRCLVLTMCDQHL